MEGKTCWDLNGVRILYLLYRAGHDDALLFVSFFSLLSYLFSFHPTLFLHLLLVHFLFLFFAFTLCLCLQSLNCERFLPNRGRRARYGLL